MASFFKNMFKKPSNIDIPQDIVPVQVGDDLVIDLSAKKIKGTRGIEQFRDITKLRLGNNSTLTSLSDSIGELTNLRELYLNSCRIGTLPESLGRLTNLRVLDLSSMYAFTSLPESIGNLTNLTDLNVNKYSYLYP